MVDYTLPSTLYDTSVAGQADSYALPQYTGELFSLMPDLTPFLSMAGGLNGGRSIEAREFSWEIEDGEAATVSNVVLENASVVGDLVKRQLVKNVVEIHMEGVDFGYSAQATVGQLDAAILVEGTNPVRSPMQHQIDLKVGKVKRDVERSFLEGTLVNPSDNNTARETQGILGAITTHTINYTTGAGGKGTAYTSLRDCLNDLLIDMSVPSTEAATAPFNMPVIFVNGAMKVDISNEYSNTGALAIRSNTVGGVNIDTLITDFGNFGVVVDRYMPAATMLVADMSVVQPVLLPIPGKGHFFVEPLAKTGAVDSAQLYGEIGLQYGPESFHGTITAWTV
jgi:hypothetical protein